MSKLAGPPQTLAGRQVGIVAGHLGNDTGAVCDDDGLTEAEVNRKIADAVVAGLKRRGAHVDLLEEYDARLRGYQADAFVSIHADSCGVDFSGYKVAGREGGLESGRLADCLWERYAAATDLPRHPDTITDNMREYHGFKRVAPTTPAAIIETGFLKADRKLLTEHNDLAAAGIIDGITCFLAPAPAATETP